MIYKYDVYIETSYQLKNTVIFNDIERLQVIMQRTIDNYRVYISFIATGSIIDKEKFRRKLVDTVNNSIGETACYESDIYISEPTILYNKGA